MSKIIHSTAQQLTSLLKSHRATGCRAKVLQGAPRPVPPPTQSPVLLPTKPGVHSGSTAATLCVETQSPEEQPTRPCVPRHCAAPPRPARRCPGADQVPPAPGTSPGKCFAPRLIRSCALLPVPTPILRPARHAITSPKLRSLNLTVRPPGTFDTHFHWECAGQILLHR